MAPSDIAGSVQDDVVATAVADVVVYVHDVGYDEVLMDVWDTDLDAGGKILLQKHYFVERCYCY